MNGTDMPRRLQVYLDRQHTRLQKYLHLLIIQEETILHGDLDTLDHYVRLERRMIADLEALGKVIRPLREMFPAVTAPGLTDLHRKATAQHARNRELLAQRIADLSRRIQGVHVPRRARSVYREGTNGSMLDVMT